MNGSMLRKLPQGPITASLVGVGFAGPAQYSLGSLFVGALAGELFGVEPAPTIGDPQIGPHHIMDSLARDYALLPEDLTATTLALGVCCVREVLPRCGACGDPARYDIWANAYQEPALLCDSCVETMYDTELGAGSATYLLTFAEMPWQVRDICDDITAELGRPSLWA